MKHLLATLLCASVFTLKAQDHKLVKLWETDELAVPESVLPSLKEKILYTSLIDGTPGEADGKGAIAKVSLEGKILNAQWINGLNAPKGLAKFGNKLYIADLTEIKVADISKGKIIATIPAPGAEFLNDVTVDSKGVVYVSDTRKGFIYRVINNKAEIWLDNMPNANGVKAIGNDLFILPGKTLVKVNQQKEVSKIAEGFAKGGDGLEQLKNGDFIVTCWAGLIYYVSKEGKIELLADTQNQNINTADIGVDIEKNIIYVPTFNKKSIIAFQLK